jgi:hypothetical protein
MFKRHLFGFIALSLFIPLALAGKPMVFSGSDGAIRGYDPVSYFTEGKPVKGIEQHSFIWNGATFRFSSAKSLELFSNDPSMYAPQYGGYCAYAVSKGATASTVPDAWTIVDDKLYLNYSLSVMRQWRSDIPGNIAAADGNWPDVLK